MKTKLKIIVNKQTFLTFHEEGQNTPFVQSQFKSLLDKIDTWTVTFGENLEVKQDDRMYKTLLFGVCEWIGGEFLARHLGMLPDSILNHDEPYSTLDIPTNYGNRGGQFNCEIRRQKKTIHIIGWISGGFFEQNPEPMTIVRTYDDGVTTIQKNENSKVGRNKPCPCRSGLKYKKCCGK